MLVILDNGHGINTQGKRSPVYDGIQLFEYEFNRDIVNRITNKLREKGIEPHILVPEIEDISLSERVNRVKLLWKQTNKQCFLISIHANAGGGTGWEAWTSFGQTESDTITNVFYNIAQRDLKGWSIRKDDTTDGDMDKEAAFYILHHTPCPAVLTENMFMDTLKDFIYITSTQGREEIADLHVKAITSYIHSSKI